jgi:hypothetical protein
MKRVIKNIPTLKKIERIEIGIDEGFGQGAWITKTFKE